MAKKDLQYRLQSVKFVSREPSAPVTILSLCSVMCGFVGIWDFKNKIDEQLLRQLADTLHYRGPDDDGIHIDNEHNVGLGHRRLAILDLSSRGRQPMHFDSAWIVYNGAVYNFKEIRTGLEAKGYTFSSCSDTEVILKSYKHAGIRAVDDFRGMFAIGIWDGSRGEMTLIRDRAGVKPLYYYFDGNLLLFSSEIKAIIRHPAVRRELNLDALSLYLKLSYIPAPLSIFKNISKLEPGKYVVVNSKGEIKAGEYWSLWHCYERGIKDSIHLDETSEREVTEELEALLTECFDLRMISDVPVGVFLSGGIDSSLVTALLHKRYGPSLKTFSIGFETKKYNEAEQAKTIARCLHTDHHELYCTPKTAMEIIPKLGVIYDEPFGDSSGIVTYLVSQFAREHVKVALSADGGDETFAGYNHYQQLDRVFRHFSRYHKLGRAAVYLASLPPVRNFITSRFENPDLKIEKIRELASKGKTITNFFLTARSMWPEEEIEMLLSYRSGYFSNYTSRFSSKEEIFRDFITFAQAVDYSSYMADDILLKVDRASMAVSLEGREPLLDHKIVEYAARLPLKLKIRNGQTKWPLRNILRKHLPAACVDRPKHGFTVPLNIWLRNDLKYLVDDYLEDKKIAEEGIFNPALVKKESDNFFSGRMKSSSRLWLLLEFELWYEKWMS